MLHLTPLKSLLLASTLALLAATPASAQEKFRVITTFTVIADMAQNVAGDAAVVSSITKPGAEIHDYQPTPGDIKRAQGAQLILSNGLNLERWFARFYQHLQGVPEVVVAGDPADGRRRADLSRTLPIAMPGCRRKITP